MHQAEEDLLVIAAQGGNQKAFTLLHKRYQAPLFHFAYKLCGNEQVAQDAVQEAWIKSASSIRRLNDPRALKAWLYRLVRWRTLDLLRQIKRHDTNTEVFDESAHSQSLETAISDSEELTAAMNRLPPIEKQMIHLFYLDEMKVNEIALVLEIPAGTVKSRLNRARTLLKQKFEI